MTFDQYIGMERDGDGTEISSVIHIQPHHCNPTGNVNGGVNTE
jgi:acyl-coenzyme A thioesterase PaaI-like protein